MQIKNNAEWTIFFLAEKMNWRVGGFEIKIFFLGTPFGANLAFIRMGKEIKRKIGQTDYWWVRVFGMIRNLKY